MAKIKFTSSQISKLIKAVSENKNVVLRSSQGNAESVIDKYKRGGRLIPKALKGSALTDPKHNSIVVKSGMPFYQSEGKPFSEAIKPLGDFMSKWIEDKKARAEILNPGVGLYLLTLYDNAPTNMYETGAGVGGKAFDNKPHMDLYGSYWSGGSSLMTRLGYTLSLKISNAAHEFTHLEDVYLYNKGKMDINQQMPYYVNGKFNPDLTPEEARENNLVPFVNEDGETQYNYNVPKFNTEERDARLKAAYGDSSVFPALKNLDHERSTTNEDIRTTIQLKFNVFGKDFDKKVDKMKAKDFMDMFSNSRLGYTKGLNILNEDQLNALKTALKTVALNDSPKTNRYVYSAKSGIKIKEKNKGKFTLTAKRAGQSILEYAHNVLSDPHTSKLLKKRAQFAVNAKKFKH